LRVSGRLVVTGPGCIVHVTGDGDRLRAVVDGTLPPVGTAVARVAHRLRDAGVRLEVNDAGGRRLLRAGAVPRSWAGRVLAGSSAVRPTARGVLMVIRARLARGARHTTEGV
jgi:hypothetical protein